MLEDVALETLLLPFDAQALRWPAEGTVRFLGARDGWPLRRFDLGMLQCVQPFRPSAEALERTGLQVVPDLEACPTSGALPLVLVLPPRQREHARAWLAQAVACAMPGGRVVACAPNAEGGKTMQADLERLAGQVDVLGKHHCRVAWTAPLPASPHDPDLLRDWAALDAPRPVLDGRYLSRPGVFAWDRIDSASALLVEHLPATLAGRVADLGAGWGYLACELLARCRDVRSIDLYEADARALALARQNVAPRAGNVAVAFHWRDVAAGVPQQYDVVVSNPPFHATGRAARPDIGRAFIAAAADALQPGGRAWFVANRQLPYEQALAQGFARVVTHVQRDGYKVIEAVKAG